MENQPDASASPEDGSVGPKTANPDQLNSKSVGPKTTNPDQLNNKAVGPKTANPDQLNSKSLGPKTANPDQLNSTWSRRRCEELQSGASYALVQTAHGGEPAAGRPGSARSGRRRCEVEVRGARCEVRGPRYEV